ncbi:AzlD domain-containing protein [Chengkuizengella axinellae]|uniref:AzlD domain-containing protein n=1 Tax=Chengkuizengella axinellae TaxID=3064388 RepID=A0ABT9J546_9BACL|nr:AzlD domain-containing protein [Chengkuizengella sp. 2205SS18-9]MDP5276745.1 AzlD domain-containing protein [Chengkuizengella sp. 2205SS18-9]
MLNHWFLIGFLSVTTYLSRIIGLEFMAGQQMSPTLRLYFQYVPIGIITALIMKQVLIPGEGQLSISVPVLVGCISTAIAIKVIKVFLPSVAIGVLFGLLVRHFL